MFAQTLKTRREENVRPFFTNLILRHRRPLFRLQRPLFRLQRALLRLQWLPTVSDDAYIYILFSKYRVFEYRPEMEVHA